MFSITDHDTIQQDLSSLIQSKMKQHKRKFCIYIPGLELSVQVCERDYHLMVYFKNQIRFFGDPMDAPLYL